LPVYRNDNIARATQAQTRSLSNGNITIPLATIYRSWSRVNSWPTTATATSAESTTEFATTTSATAAAKHERVSSS
jgi:hypothetical protein